MVIPGMPHHVTHRGRNQQNLFLDETDFRQYVDFLKERSIIYELDILGYCIMPNHVHLIVTPSYETSLCKCIGNTHRQYSQYFNKRYGSYGHQWQNRYYSYVLDKDHLLLAILYVDKNPVRAGMANSARDYFWSSALAHLGKENPNGLLDMQKWADFIGEFDYESALDSEEDEMKLRETRTGTATQRGR
jgi:putative transposase